MLQAGHGFKLIRDLSQVRMMMPSSCVFVWLNGFGHLV